MIRSVIIVLVIAFVSTTVAHRHHRHHPIPVVTSAVAAPTNTTDPTFAPVQNLGAPSKLSDLLNPIISAFLPVINKSMVELPAAYGDCSHSEPQPCINKGDLYYKHKSWQYKVRARWIGGLNTGSITSATFGPGPDGSTLRLDLAGVFAQLPVNIEIDECFTFDKCSKLWDNHSGCCGSNKHFSVSVEAKCQPAKPYLSTASVTALKTDSIHLSESIGPIKFNVADLTGAIKSAAQGLLKDLLTSHPFIPYNGQTYSIVGLVESFAEQRSGGANVVCA
jgi:hypothetical protein